MMRIVVGRKMRRLDVPFSFRGGFGGEGGIVDGV